MKSIDLKSDKIKNCVCDTNSISIHVAKNSKTLISRIRKIELPNGVAELTTVKGRVIEPEIFIYSYSDLLGAKQLLKSIKDVINNFESDLANLEKEEDGILRELQTYVDAL